MNKTHFKKILNKIKADPDNWNQETWHCGTKHCIAGHAQIEMGRFDTDSQLEDTLENSETRAHAFYKNENTVKNDAREYLQMSYNHSKWLFSGIRTIEDFDEYYKRNGLVLDDGFNIDGFDKKGFNRAGYNKNGFDKSGLDRDGFNKDNKRREK